MFQAAHRLTLFALYQTFVVLGIFLLPVALLARKAGLNFPLGRLILATGKAYERASNR